MSLRRHENFKKWPLGGIIVPGAQPGSQCPRIVCYYPKGIQRGTSKHNQLLISDSALLQLKVIILKPIGAQYLGVIIYITNLCQREKKAIVEITIHMFVVTMVYTITNEGKKFIEIVHLVFLSIIVGLYQWKGIS